MKTEKATFAGSDGQQLAAELDLPPGPPRPVALFAHCFSCGKDLKSARRLTTRLTDRGFAVMRFDFTGLGSSEGDFADTNFSSNVADLLAAADWLRQTYSAPSLLIGHSLGGAAVIAAASQIPELTAIATIGAPADPGHVAHLFSCALDEIEENGHADVSIAGRMFTVKKQFLDDIAGSQLDEALAALDIPLLVMHAPGDTVVAIDNAQQIFAAASHPKSFVALDGADHLMSEPAQAEYAAELLATWADRYVPTHLAASDDVIVAASEGEVVVAERGTGKFAQVIRVADRHALLADEPIGIGDDTGPAPYDLLLAALGACTSMTVRMYADRKKWPLEDVAVRLSHSKVHADDCAACESDSGKVDMIERELVLGGPLDDEQRAKLMEIADRCPVHRSLHDETHVTTVLVRQ
jgi:putative redox protein